MQLERTTTGEHISTLGNSGAHDASIDSTRSRSNRQIGVSQINRSFLRSRQMKSLIVRFVREDEGQDLIEYALLAGLIALVASRRLHRWGATLRIFTNVSAPLTPPPRRYQLPRRDWEPMRSHRAGFFRRRCRTTFYEYVTNFRRRFVDRRVHYGSAHAADPERVDFFSDCRRTGISRALPAG